MIPWLLLFGSIIVVFRNWFSLLPVSAGDLSFFYSEWIVNYLNPPFYWETFRNAGLGGRSFLFQGVYFYNLPLGFLGQYFNYALLERIVWFFPLLLIGVISAYALVREINLFPKKYYPLSVFIFLLNTYFLMVISGGQLTVALAYVFVPATLAYYLKLLKAYSFRNSLIFSILLALLIAWDFRLTYLAIIIMVFISLGYFLVLPKKRVKVILNNLKILISSAPFIIGIHFFWLFPYLLFYRSPVAELTPAHQSITGIKYFSSADFSHAFSLLQPNWPENLFGLTHFQEPGFLLLPLIAFSSLLFNAKKKIIFFSLLSLLGVFLAKGANAPFGNIYLWLFAHLPGFIMFRDPTKWYLFTVLSYMVLIPYAVFQISLFLQKRKLISGIPYLLVYILLIVLIFPAVTGKVGGTLKNIAIPQEYISLKDKLAKDNNFSRTLWFPSLQRFGYYDFNHPAIAGDVLLGSTDPNKIIQILKSKTTENKIKALGVKYVIIPNDSLGEIFLTERKYDPQKRISFEKELDKIPWLKNKKDLGGVTFYEIPNPNPRFYDLDHQVSIKSLLVNPTKYEVSFTLEKKSTLIFAEMYDPLWELKTNKGNFKSIKTNNSLNSFSLEKGTYQGTVEFIPQAFWLFASVVSLLTLVMMILLYFLTFTKYRLFK